MQKLTHIDARGEASMVDVSTKPLLLREAVAHNYCAYPAMDRDVAFAPLHQNPEFATIRLAAMECQKRFTDHIAQRQ